MKIKYYFVFLMLAILAILLMGAAATLSLRVSGQGFNPGVKKIESQGIEEDLCFDPTYGADNGFVVNPYQAGNQDGNQALIIGASVSYILKEVKAFTIFAVALAGLALITFVTIAFIILNRISRPVVKAEKPEKNEEAVMKNEESDNVNDDNKDPIDCIGDWTYRAAFLAKNIDEMLVEIDKAVEKSKVKLSILL